MKNVKLIALAVAALAAGPALANDIPVPSFNDAPEIYSHPGLRDSGSNASQGPSRPSPASTPMNYAPWITTPSSGA